MYSLAIPYEVVELLAIYLEDSRGLYLTCQSLFANSTDRIYWESRGKDRIKNHLVKIPTNKSLSKFAKYGNLPMVRHLHLQGADITLKNNYAVRWASASGHVEIVKYLHIAGADITDNYNEAVEWASSNGHLEVVKYLHAAGADITDEDNYAIRWAIAYGHVSVAKYLHLAGVIIDNELMEWVNLCGDSAMMEYFSKITNSPNKKYTL